MYEKWIESMLPSPLAAPLEVVKERPWSLVVKVSTVDGVFWFKENRGETVYEAGLMRALHTWVPGRVLEPVAVDAVRGWSLLPDGGPTMREAGDMDWAAMLVSYARLQRDLVPHAQGMRDLGVPDQSPNRLPDLMDLLPAFEGRQRAVDMCRRLEESPIPMSLQHDDLHDANVFASGRFYDWGDASVSHPFGVLLVPLNIREHERERLVEAYLEQWSDLASMDELRAEVRLAITVAKVGRALSWQRGLLGATPEQVQEWGDPVNAWLGALLDDSPY